MKEYYTNNTYNIILYQESESFIVERTEIITQELFQVKFKSQESATNFLNSKKYELYRITLE